MAAVEQRTNRQGSNTNAVEGGRVSRSKKNPPAATEGTQKDSIGVESGSSLSADKHSNAVLGLNGVHIIVVSTGTGRTHRRAFWTLAAAQRAVDRSTASGNTATIVLCQLIPVGDPL